MRHHLTDRALLLVIAALVTLTSGGGANAQSKAGPYRSFAMSVPIISLTRESITRMELNLNAVATVAIEATWVGQIDEYREKDAEETGEQINSKGRGAALFISRYSEPHAMGGFYWTLGAGYRQMQADWQTPIDKEDPDTSNYALADAEQRYHHEAQVAGMTGHGRVGYRYVGTEWPLTIGAYLGVRHFQSKVVDRDDRDVDAQGRAIAPMSEQEREKLERHYMTAPEPGLEFGFVF